MPTLHVCELSNDRLDGSRTIEGAINPGFMSAAPLGPRLGEQFIAIGGSSVASNAFNAKTNIVLVAADHAASIAFGSAPVATTSIMRIAANKPGGALWRCRRPKGRGDF